MAHLLPDSSQPHDAEPVDELSEIRIELAELRADFEEFRSQAQRDRDSIGGFLHGLKTLVNGGAPSASSPANNVPQSQSREKWELWKRKLGGKQAEFIDALLDHGEMTGAQLQVACRCAHQTVYDTIAKLNRAQLLNKNGGKFSLKED